MDNAVSSSAQTKAPQASDGVPVDLLGGAAGAASNDDTVLDPVRIDAPTSEVLQTHVHGLTMGQTLELVASAIAERKRMRIGVVNAAKLCKMLDDPELAEDVRSSDVVLADGMSVVWAAKLLNEPLPERVAGIDIMHGIMQRGDPLGYRVFLLGASEEVSLQVEAKFRARYPGVTIAGRRNGYFDDEADAPGIADDIRDSCADVLFVAMTSPKKERFMGRFGDHMNVPVVHGVGGSFDVVAGKVERAPDAWQKIGMEWAYRALQEPRRLGGRYLSTNWNFVRKVLQQKFGRRAAPK